MKVFIKIVSIILLSFLVSWGIYFLIEKGRNKYFYHTNEHYDELFKQKTGYDILMLGSSRTHLHNDPKVIDSITSMNSYNGGIEGGSMMEIEVVLNGYLAAHPKPKLIVMEVSMLSLNMEKNTISNPTFYLEYLNNSGVSHTLNEHWKYTGFLKYFPFFRLSQFDDINKTYALKGYKGVTEPMYGGSYKGYAENSSTIISDTTHDNSVGCNWVTYSQKGQDYLNDILRTCKMKDIPVAVIYSPEFRKLNFECPEGKRIIDSVAAVSARYGYPFWNYLNDPIVNDHNQFFNIGHLNKQGAEKFSAILGTDIKKYFDERKK